MTKLEEELQKALSIIDANWKMQNNFNDYRSNFIYKVDTLEDVINNSKINGVDEKYAIHRWYNFKTSIACENIFVEFGAIKEEDFRNKEIDIYIDGVPFDVKLTVYPNALSEHPYDLKTREGKNNMIRWYYEHQSQQQRKHLANRLFIVCDGKSQYNSLCLKADFQQIREKVQAFILESKTNGFNTLKIYDNGKEYIVQSDIIYINE